MFFPVIARNQGSGRRWFPWGASLRLLAFIVTVFYLNFLPVHLLVETHAHDVTSLKHHDHDHAGHDEHHVPHPVAEQWGDLLAKTQSLLICFLALPASEVSILAPDQHVLLPTQLHFRSIVETPPDPFQPRAPPSASQV